MSFLTILPARGSLEDAARGFYLSPAVGAAVGVLAGLAGLAVAQVADPLLAGVAAAAALAALTGMHHADGLADLADGLMAHGGRQRRLGAMRDTATGTAGAAATSVSFVSLAVLASLAGPWLLEAVIVSEMAAKFSMVAASRAAPPAAPGSGSLFAGMLDWRRVAVSGAVAASPALLLGPGALLVLGAAVGAGLAVAAVSSRALGGITGDVLGAVNEVSRIAALAVAVSL